MESSLIPNAKKSNTNSIQIYHTANRNKNRPVMRVIILYE